MKQREKSQSKKAFGRTIHKWKNTPQTVMKKKSEMDWRLLLIPGRSPLETAWPSFRLAICRWSWALRHITRGLQISSAGYFSIAMIVWYEMAPWTCKNRQLNSMKTLGTWFVQENGLRAISIASNWQWVESIKSLCVVGRYRFAKLALVYFIIKYSFANNVEQINIVWAIIWSIWKTFATTFEIWAMCSPSTPWIPWAN